MKVLKIIHTQGHGGAENTFRWLAWGLRQEGVDVIAAIPEVTIKGAENWIAPALSEVNVPYHVFDTTGSPLRLLHNIGALIDQVKPDIVHSHLLDSNFYSSIASKLRNIPHISTEHGDVSFTQTVSSRVKFALIPFCSEYFICVSNAVRQMASKMVLHRGKLKTIYNGIRFMESCHSTFRNEIGIPEHAILIGNIGNLYPVKGQKFLVSGFAELMRSCPEEVYLALVGRGAEQEGLMRQVKELAIPEGRVVFTGFRKDIENIINSLDLYVQPSLFEGHPVAVLEAMSLGIPIIASAVGGIPEIIGAEQYGKLVPPGDTEKLYGCMHDFVCNRSSYQEKGLAAKKYMRDAFSIKTMACNYLEIYKQILGCK